jgi:MFS family permease
MGIQTFVFSIFDVIFPLYLDYKQISLPQISIIFAIPILLSIITRVIVGVQADIYGRKVFYSLALIGSSLINFCFVFANSAWQFLAIKLFGGLSSAFGSATEHLLIYESVPKKKAGTAFGRILGILSILSFLGTLLAGPILIFLGYFNTLIFCALFLFIALLIFLSFKERKRFNKYKYFHLSETLNVCLSRNLKIYTIAIFFFEISTSMIGMFTIQLFLTKILGLSPITLSIVLAGYTFLSAFSSLFLGKLSDIYSPKKIYFYSFLISAIVLFVIGFSSSASLVSFLWIILGVLMGIGAPAIGKMVNMYARARFRGRDTNISKAIGSVGDFVGPLLAGYIGVYGFNLVFIISSIFLIFSAFIINFIKD